MQLMLAPVSYKAVGANTCYLNWKISIPFIIDLNLHNGYSV